MNKSLDEKEITALVERLAPVMTQFELALMVAYNAQEQWSLRCAAASGMKGYSTTELMVLHMVGYRSKRLHDICFSAKIEDTHIVAYALRSCSGRNWSRAPRSERTPSSCRPSWAGGTSKITGLSASALKTRPGQARGGRAGNRRASSDLLGVLSGLYEQAARTANNSLAN